MKTVKGKVRLSPIIDRPSELLDVQVKVIERCIVTEVGEGCECKVGDEVYIKRTSLKKFHDEGIDGELIAEEDKMVQLIVKR